MIDGNVDVNNKDKINPNNAKWITKGFNNLKTINNLDTNVDTSKVTNMNSMFGDSNLTSVGDLGKWNTSNVTNMLTMFDGSQLTPPAWYH